MKAFSIFAILISTSAYAHDSYVSQNRLHNAIRAVYSTFPNSGFRGDCFSCHSNVPQIGAGFGTDFRNRTQALFGNANTQLSQAQIQTLVNDATIKGLDSDGDSYNNQAEFQAGSDPGDRNSTPVANPSPSPSPSPRPSPTPRPPVNGDVTKSTSGADANANYLNSGGCGLSRRQAQEILINKETERANVFGLLGLVLAPFALAIAMRKRK